MERRPIHFTVHVRNVSSKTQGQSTSSSPKTNAVQYCLRPWCSLPSLSLFQTTPSPYSCFPKKSYWKFGGFASVEAMRNLIATCKYIRNQSNTWFLQLLASENNPDRATSGFIIDAIGNKGNTCLWRNATFFIKDHDIPKDLSIHLFANTTAKKISSDEVRSMIIQSSGSPESYEDSRKFLKFLFSKVSFKNLKCLMFCGIELSNDFSQEMEALNLDVFHMRNFRYRHRFSQTWIFPLL